MVAQIVQLCILSQLCHMATPARAWHALNGFTGQSGQKGLSTSYDQPKIYN